MQPPAKPQSEKLLYVFDMAYLITYLHEAQLLGFREARSLLEGLLDGFDTVRDTELDDYVTTVEQAEKETDEIPEPPNE